jgi:hypothetical protein
MSLFGSKLSFNRIKPAVVHLRFLTWAEKPPPLKRRATEVVDDFCSPSLLAREILLPG